MRALCRSLLVVAVLMGAFASTASAQAPPTIDAVDSPVQAFTPNDVTVTSGTTVRWEFDQAAATHSVTSTSGNWNVDETRNAGGEAVTHTFDAPGTYTFHCKFHPSMTGTVTVNAAGDPRFDVLVFSRTTGFRHTDAIDAGKVAIPQMGEDGNYNVDLSEDPTKFTDAGLRDYEVVVFLNDDGEGILNAAQRTAFERWTQRGGGIVAIHADANADRNWAWKGDMNGGAWFNNHPDGALQFQQAKVLRADDTHPATVNVPEEWTREDEWYNFTAEPQNVHVLLKLDESSYVEQDGSDGVDDDHPIAWCSNYDGGRHFYTALGHKGSYWSEPFYLAHIRGAIEWAAGEAPGDCGPERDGLPTDASFDKVTIDDTTENPMELAVDPDGNVFYIELAGRVKYYDAATDNVRAIGQIPVHRGNENGLLGITLDPNFKVNHWIYLFYSAPTPEEQHISRFTIAPDGTIDMTSEKVLLRVPHQRIVCCHSSGSLTFGPDGNLYISTGDDTEHAQSNGFAPLDDDVVRNNPGDNVDADHAYDSRRTSGNTNDLRGKILRIHPEPDGTYTIPAGNLFPPFSSDPTKTKPEIYTMGHRNPFRIQVDQETGWLYNGEVGPDANSENANRGPRGYDELNQIRQAGNMGWPYCIADNKAYRDWTFPNGPAGAAFDCANGPTNTSNYNTGLTQLPAARSALLWWPYAPHANAPNFPWNTAPLAIPEGPGRTAIAGPIYHFNPASTSETKFPAWFDDKVFFADWSRDWIATLELNVDGSPKAITEFMPNADFRHPQDIEMGANGSLYILEWGRDFNYAGSGINPDSGLYRIDYAKGTRTPVARATADKDSGPTPLTVNFSSAGSEDADGDDLTFSWDFGDGQTSTEANPTHTFTTAGTFNVRLTATDSTGKSGSSTVVINAGNTRPTVTLTTPVQGGVFDWGDEIPYSITVTDPEDGTIDCNRVTVNVGVFHDEGGNAHVHPGTDRTGCSGTIAAPATSGHEKSANIALVLIANYTDTGGAPGSVPLDGASTRRLTPKQIQAEHYTDHTGTQTNTVGNAEGGRTVGYTDAGEFIYFEPVSLANIDGLTIRYAAGEDGGFVDVREGAVDGPVVGTAALPPTASWTDFQNVTIPLDPGGASGRLYFTFRAMNSANPTDLFDLDEFTFIGKGVASNSTPTASAQADKVAGSAPLTVNFTGTGSDADGDAVTYAWDFTSDGTVDATTANATHTYTQAGQYTATFTVSDGTRSRSVEIDIEAYPPLASCPGNDDFDGTSLDRNRWSVVREDANFLSVDGGTLNLNAQPGEDIHGGATGQRNIVLQDLPDSGPWTATARVTWNPTVNYQNAGLVIYTDDANWIKSGMVWSNGRAFEAFKELNNNAAGLGAQSVDASFPSTFYVRFTSNGTNVQAQRSADGQTWTNTGNATNLSGLNNPKIGMYATASTNAGTQAATARFDYFTLDAPQDPSDEFDGTALNLCRWSQIVRHQPGGYTVADGKLTLPAAHGDFFAAAPNNNPNILLQPAPAGPWTMTTRLTFDPNENYEQAGLLVYGDDANYVKADYVYANGRGLEFLREANNTAAGFGGFVGIGTKPTTVDMRITSDGTTLRAYYRFAGEGWTPYGEPALLSSVPNAKIGIYANDSNATVTTRNDAVFDFFRITAGLPDTTAPVTTAAVAPQPVNGWNTGNVTVTLSTEAGATTEYKLGSGAYQSYSGPVTVSDEGTTVVTYRSRDAEGNLEAEKTVTVRIDKTAPTSSASPDGGTFTAPVAVTLTGADGGSGVDKLEYKLDSGDWTTYSGPVTISGNGPHTLQHRAADVAGNVSAVGSATYTINGGGAGAPTVQAFADPESGPAPLHVHFSAAALDPDGGALEYEWTLGDGTVLDSEFDYTFTQPGSYTATVTVTDPEGKTATDDVTVTVQPAGGGNVAPTVTASADKPSGPAPHTVAFTATGSDDRPVGELEYRWEFGDGGVSFEQNPTHRYMAKGTYTATVTVTDAGDKTGTATVPITVTDPPGNRAPTVKAAAAPKSGTAPLSVLLTASGTDPDGDALTYSWDYGDGSAAGSGKKVTHVYASGGTYTATVTARDPGGMTGTATVSIVVGNPPGNQAPTVQIAADPAGGSAPLAVRFSASGRDPDGDPIMYVWDFGDGGKAGGKSATHTYAQPGTYTAKVTVTDSKGASGSATVAVVVQPAGQGQVRGAQAELAVPGSVRAFVRRGLRVKVTCVRSGAGRARLTVTRASARRLALGSRTVASRQLRCRAGRDVSVRLKPSRRTARRLVGARTLRLTLRVAVKGSRAMSRRVTIR